MLLKPDIKLKGVTDITPDLLKKHKIDTLILDVDNTLSTHHGYILTDGLIGWITMMKENGITLTVLSNSKKKRVKPFAEKINLPYISLGLKPLPFGYIRAIRSSNSKRMNTAIVGDQIFTDVLGGSLVGIKKILLTPIKPEDGWSFKLRRKLEKLIFRIYKITETEE